MIDVMTERRTWIAAIIEARALATSVGAVLPRTAANVAHEMLEENRPLERGKIVPRRAA